MRSSVTTDVFSLPQSRLYPKVLQVICLMQRQGNSKVKDIFSNLLRIIARLGEVDDLKGVNSKGLEMEVSRDGSESQDPGINATASEASSVSSSRGFFVTETDFAHLAATLLTMVNEAHHSMLSCPTISRPLYLCS